MFATDILKVLYAPHKAFKQIVQNPKYWGVLAIFIIFIAVQSGFQYAQSEKIYYEQTTPAPTQLSAWTDNATLWQASPSGVAISNNYADTFNNSYYGNSSLQFAVSNSNTISMTLTNTNSVSCGPNSYQNLSMRIKTVEPSAIPTKVILTLYSPDNSSFQYDLTPIFSNSTTNVWNNITVPVGPDAAGWQSQGNANWSDITSLKLDFTFSATSNITLRVQGLFFRGLYQTFIQVNSTLFIVSILQQAIFQFVSMWILFTGIMFITIKGLKGNVTWKPLFVAVGFALTVLIIQALLSLAATSVLPTLYSPIELQTGLAGEAQAINSSLTALTATYTTILGIIAIATYTWIAALGALIIRTLLPEFTWSKCILTSAVGIIVTVILTALLGL